MRVDHATMRASVMIRNETGREMMPMMRRETKVPPPHFSGVHSEESGEESERKEYDYEECEDHD